MKLHIKALQLIYYLILLPALVLMMLVLPTNTVRAADVSNNVTSLTVSPSEISDGGKTTVKFTFDNHYQQIQSGDTITVNWQNSGIIYGSGFQKTVRLSIDGNHVGDLIVSDSQAKVIFNDGITGLQNITGWGEFEILGRDMTQTTEEHSGSFIITSGNKSTSVLVTKGAAGVGNVFYYKTGDMQTNDTEHVRWFLNINNEKAYVTGEIRILDQIQPGQTLDMNSFGITVEGNRNAYYYGSTAINDFLRDFPGSTLSADSTTGQITVIIPYDYASLNAYSIMYLTKINNLTQVSFDNHSKAWYQEYGKEIIDGQEFNYSVDNVNISGGADGNKPTTTTTTTTTTSTTTVAPTTTAEPTTTTVAPATTTAEPTTTVAPTTTTAEPSTTVAPTTTTAEPTTTVAPATTTAEPTTTTAAPATTTAEPTTTVAPATTTAEPSTTTVAPAATTAEPTTTTGTTTTTEPGATTVAPTTTTVGIAETTDVTPPPSGKKGKALPKTGQESGLVTTLIGFALLVVSGLAGILYRKSKKA